MTHEGKKMKPISHRTKIVVKRLMEKIEIKNKLEGIKKNLNWRVNLKTIKL